MTNLNGNSVTQCTIAGTSLTGCATMPTTGTPNFNGPAGIAISGTTAYVANSGGNSVTQCTIAGTSLTGCATTGSSFTFPAGIAISGTTAYVTNNQLSGGSGNSVTQCTIVGTSLTSCAETGSSFTAPAAIAISANFNNPNGIAISGTTAYVTNAGGNSVTQCIAIIGA